MSCTYLYTSTPSLARSSTAQDVCNTDTGKRRACTERVQSKVQIFNTMAYSGGGGAVVSAATSSKQRKSGEGEGEGRIWGMDNEPRLSTRQPTHLRSVRHTYTTRRADVMRASKRMRSKPALRLAWTSRTRAALALRRVSRGLEYTAADVFASTRSLAPRLCPPGE
ncbi:hypothetical protein OH76DRAFT_1409861 [Lentinus brumalis]|uniref:Uncharacterized protein n=1 Tax=Lentinus brumalis TaxID=2498619 RepID=A0A371CU25_9APHY|nr:hypothetical protein OH76DRAFT_1409861 [Polyporus brumalis]